MTLVVKVMALSANEMTPFEGSVNGVQCCATELVVVVGKFHSCRLWAWLKDISSSQEFG